VRGCCTGSGLPSRLWVFLAIWALLGLAASRGWPRGADPCRSGVFRKRPSRPCSLSKDKKCHAVSIYRGSIHQNPLRKIAHGCHYPAQKKLCLVKELHQSLCEIRGPWKRQSQSVLPPSQRQEITDALCIHRQSSRIHYTSCKLSSAGRFHMPECTLCANLFPDSPVNLINLLRLWSLLKTAAATSILLAQPDMTNSFDHSPFTDMRGMKQSFSVREVCVRVLPAKNINPVNTSRKYQMVKPNRILSARML
jgi:hypothetical protein